MGWGGWAAPPLCLSPWFSLLPLLQGDAAQLSDPLLFLSLTRSLLFPRSPRCLPHSSPCCPSPTMQGSQFLLSFPGHCRQVSFSLPGRETPREGGFRDLSKVTVHRKDLNLIRPTSLQLSIVVSSPASPWFLQSSVS